MRTRHQGVLGHWLPVTTSLAILLLGCAKGEGGDAGNGFGGLPANAGDDAEDDEAPEDDDGQDADGQDGDGDGANGDGPGDEPPTDPPADPPADPPEDPPADPPADPAPLGDCCEAQPTPGCDDPVIASCVCDSDAFCCDNKWDQTCVDLASSECSSCGGDTEPEPEPEPEDPPEPPPADPPALDSPCCVAQDGAGCALDPGLEACVCGADPFCCEVLWDDACLETAHAVCEACC